MIKRITIIENNIIATNTIRKKLTTTLIKNGYHVTILTTGLSAELEQARQQGFNIVDVKASNQSPLEILNYIKNLYKALKKSNPDVCLTFTIRPAIWGNLVTRRLKIPTITNITGIGPLFDSNHFSYKFARKLYKFALKKTKRIFFQNNTDLQLFINKGFVNKQKIEKIPGSGVDYEYYKPMPDIEKKAGFSFIFISRLIRDKGIVEYVEAAKLLKQEFPSINFLVLGPLWTQNLKSNIITQTELDLWIQEGAITYLGTAADIRPFIAAADCLVLPSYREGMSNVLLEASSMQKPCIASDTTGCNDIVEDDVTGFLSQVKNVADLSLQMKKMYNLSEEKRIEMGIAARKKIIKEFDKKIVIDAYLNAIKELE
jgi:glycosyltransferase involved in cell wall biosynthesis